MIETENYKLKKPDYDDGADIGVLNHNADIIDAELKKSEDEINTHTSDTTAHITATERGKWNKKADDNNVSFGLRPEGYELIANVEELIEQDTFTLLFTPTQDFNKKHAGSSGFLVHFSFYGGQVYTLYDQDGNLAEDGAFKKDIPCTLTFNRSTLKCFFKGSKEHVKYANDATHAGSACHADGATIAEKATHADKAEKANYSSRNISRTTPALRNIKMSTSSPSGGSNGDIWLQYK